MGAGLFRLERKGRLKPVFLLSIVLVLVVELAWSELARNDHGLLNAVFRGFHTIKGGAGFLALEALVASDYAPVQGFVLAMAMLYTLLNLVIDLLYVVIDPRVRLSA